MANMRLATATRNAAVNGVTALITANALLRIYAGTQPASGGGADNSNTHVLLGTLAFASAPFAAAASGTATAAAITSDASADASGTATWARVLTSGGTVIYDGDVGTSGASINLNTVNITQGGALAITSMTITMPAA